MYVRSSSFGRVDLIVNLTLAPARAGGAARVADSKQRV